MHNVQEMPCAAAAYAGLLPYLSLGQIQVLRQLQQKALYSPLLSSSQYEQLLQPKQQCLSQLTLHYLPAAFLAFQALGCFQELLCRLRLSLARTLER
jgi:hypothetical protein